MIKPHCHTREWIEAQRDALGGADALILERAIMALTLLTALSRTSLKFVFKGGTSLLLHLPQPLRLSIDIDIVAATNREELAPLLDSLVGNSPFLRWEEHVRGGGATAKATALQTLFQISAASRRRTSGVVGCGDGRKPHC